MTRIQDLGKVIKKITNGIDNLVNGTMRTAASTALQGLVRDTPVNTGAAVSNWVVSLGGRPSNGFIPPHVPGLRGSTRLANQAVTLERGLTVIAEFNRFKLNKIYIVNNTPYIGALNSGSSTQAPAGFVEAAAMAARFSVKNVKLKV